MVPTAAPGHRLETGKVGLNAILIFSAGSGSAVIVGLDSDVCVIWSVLDRARRQHFPGRQSTHQAFPFLGMANSRGPASPPPEVIFLAEGV